MPASSRHSLTFTPLTYRAKYVATIQPSQRGHPQDRMHGNTGPLPMSDLAEGWIVGNQTITIMPRYKVVTPHSSTRFNDLDEARKFAAGLAMGPDAIRSPSIIRIGTDNAEIPTPKTMKYHTPIITQARLGLQPLNRRRTRAHRRAITAAILTALTSALAMWAILR